MVQNLSEITTRMPKNKIVARLVATGDLAGAGILLVTAEDSRTFST